MITPTRGGIEMPDQPVDVRLVVTDMDGTLLRPDGTVPDGLWPLLGRMRERGIAFAPASGRQHATLERSFDVPGVLDDLVIIAENGSYVTRGGVEVSSDTMPRDAVTAVVHAVRELATERDAGAVVAGKRQAYTERSDDEFLDYAGRFYARLEVVDDALAVDDEVLKIAVYDIEDAEGGVLPALERFRATQQVVVSGQHWIDVMNQGVTKGVAVRQLQEALGVTPEQTVVFGDYLNDLEMLDAGAWSFAMADAHPEVLERARYRAPSSAEAGVVTVLENLLAG
jgi:Cof subfamily protein (haloacid dehalogenase superfamily)